MRCALGVAVSLSLGMALPWGAPALAATWTVDAACPDAAVDPADVTPPFCTIGRGAMAALPGDTVLVMPGIYREQVTPPTSGVAGAPIRFVAGGDGVSVRGTVDLSDPGGWSPTATNAWTRIFEPTSVPRQVFLDGARLAEASGPSTTTSGSWFYDEATDLLYVDVGGPNPALGHLVEAGARTHGFNLTGKSHIEVEGFDIRGQNTNGLRIVSAGEIVVRRNVVSNTSSRGINVEAATGTITIDANEVFLAGAIGIRVASTGGAIVTGNRSHDNANHGIGFTGSSGGRIARNVLYANAVPDGVSAVGVDISSGSSNNVIRENVAYANQDSGLEVDGGSDANLFVRNQSFANGDHGFDVRGSSGTRFVSNSVYGNAVDGFSVENSADDTELRNNIASDNGRFELFVGEPPGLFASDYDILWDSGAGDVVRFGASSYASLGDFWIATGNEGHGRGEDPRFVDPANGNLRLRLGPAVDAADAGAAGFVLEDPDGVLPFDIPAIANTGAGDPPYADLGVFEYTELPPVAFLEVAPNGRPAPSRVTANASKSTDDVAIASYVFDFGDGTTVGPQTSPIARHLYTDPGSYLVTVTVTDEAGFTSQDSRRVRVRRPRNR